MTPHGECPVCGCMVSLNLNGGLRTHRADPSVLEDYPWANCYGSHAWPKETTPPSASEAPKAVGRG